MLCSHWLQLPRTTLQAPSALTALAACFCKGLPSSLKYPNQDLPEGSKKVLFQESVPSPYPYSLPSPKVAFAFGGTEVGSSFHTAPWTIWAVPVPWQLSRNWVKRLVLRQCPLHVWLFPLLRFPGTLFTRRQGLRVCSVVHISLLILSLTEASTMCWVP